MLSSDSDAEAQQDRQQLLSITTALLASNHDLSRRMARLEDCFDTASTIRPYRPPSSVITAIPANNPVDTQLDGSTRRFSIESFNPIQEYHFDFELKASRVYRKVKRETADYSFRSSAMLSHAWSALSDNTLSNISIISVIALPIDPEDITNGQHYTFYGISIEVTPPTAPAPLKAPPNDHIVTEVCLSPTSSASSPTSALSLTGSFASTRSAPLRAVLESPSELMKITVVGATDVDVDNLIRKASELHNRNNRQTQR
jgi:hypothetical protein